MSDNEQTTSGPAATGDSAESDQTQRPGDDERASQEQIEQSGEPERDRLGNQDGSS